MKVEKGLATLLENRNINGLRPEVYTAEKLQRYFLDYSAQNSYIKKPQSDVAACYKGAEYIRHQLISLALRCLR